jgi:hypothetical protein
VPGRDESAKLIDAALQRASTRERVETETQAFRTQARRTRGAHQTPANAGSSGTGDRNDHAETFALPPLWLVFGKERSMPANKHK